MDTNKRWWLWEWTITNGRRFSVVQDFPSSTPGDDCTEVRIVPVDAVVCEKGSREWAVVMAMRGKVVKHETSERAYTNPAHVLGRALAEYNWYELPVEDPLRCPACGAGSGDIENSSVRGWRCECQCGAAGQWKTTLAEAREAFRRMGK